MAIDAGGTSQRLNPGSAMIRSLDSSLLMSPDAPYGHGIVGSRRKRLSHFPWAGCNVVSDSDQNSEAYQEYCPKDPRLKAFIVRRPIHRTDREKCCGHYGRKHPAMPEVPCPPERKSIPDDHSWVGIAGVDHAESPSTIVGTKNLGLFVGHIGFG